MSKMSESQETQMEPWSLGRTNIRGQEVMAVGRQSSRFGESEFCEAEREHVSLQRNMDLKQETDEIARCDQIWKQVIDSTVVPPVNW